MCSSDFLKICGDRGLPRPMERSERQICKFIYNPRQEISKKEKINECRNVNVKYTKKCLQQNLSNKIIAFKILFSPTMFTYIYIYIVLVVTKPPCEFVANQVQYNMESDQYLG